MATKFYLQNTAAPVSPTGTAVYWDAVSGTTFSAMGPDKLGAATTKAVSESVTIISYFVRGAVFVGPLVTTAGVLDGDVSFVVGARETTTNNLRLRVSVGIVRAGALLSGGSTTSVIDSTAQGRADILFVFSAVSVAVGDRLAVEIGLATNNTTATTQTLTMNYGNTGATDLSAGSTSVTTQPGYVLFNSANVDALFAPVLEPGRGFFASC